MLRKLMKFEMTAMGRVMLPVYVVLLAASAAMAASIRTDLQGSSIVYSMLRRLEVIFVIVFFLVAAAAALMIMVLVIQRFYKNLLGQEGYLMFTLPATTAQHLMSKMITSVIWILIGGAAGVLSGLIITVGTSDLTVEEMFGGVKEILGVMADYLGNGSAAKGAVLLVLLVLVGLVTVLAEVYFSFAVGHLWSGHRILGSVLVWIAVKIVESWIQNRLGVRGLVRIYDQAESAAMGYSVSAGSVAGLGFSLAVSVICLTVTWYILDKKLNLE